MATEVILPKVDMDMATGTISKWHVVDGEAIKKGQQIFEIETDKSAMEIESPADGVIKIGGAKVGLVLPIGAVVAMIYGAGEVPADFVGKHIDIANAQTARNSPHREVESNTTLDLRATPMARRLARESGINLTLISGSGIRGRIVASDLSTITRDDMHPGFAPGSYTLKPIDSMRRAIAQRLLHSKQTVPHFYLSVTCTIDNLLEMRERLNQRGGNSPRLSINDFVIKALALALQKVPDANVTYSNEGILHHHNSDVAVAVSVAGGIVTPVIRNAEQKNLDQISIEMKDLAARAKLRKLLPEDYQGGAAAISNLGMFGIEQFTAIINPPQATILAVGAAIERFIPFNKQPLLVTQIKLTLSCDHRAVDGSVGARFLKALQSMIEVPALMLE
jgi:pyruvate dehydrogenase E2 component (dihydrolipoamide acetyltransferase)